jgi:hypothetical protein
LGRLGRQDRSSERDVQDVEGAAGYAGEQVEAAVLHDDPFAHVVVDELLPADVFERLAAAIPAERYFDGNKKKLDLDTADANEHFRAAPERTQAVWRAVRDAIFRDAVTPILARRFADGLREKYEFLFGPEIASEVLARGFTSTPGRIQGRRPGYDLKPHLDSAHFGITCLLYFSTSGADDSGALCLFRPEREPEVRHSSTYYPVEQEGISIEVAKTIPIHENMLVAFLNERNALHGVKIDSGAQKADFVRYAYQCQIVPVGFSIEKLYPRLSGEAKTRWQRVVERKQQIDSM